MLLSSFLSLFRRLPPPRIRLSKNRNWQDGDGDGRAAYGARDGAAAAWLPAESDSSGGIWGVLAGGMEQREEGACGAETEAEAAPRAAAEGEAGAGAAEDGPTSLGKRRKKWIVAFNITILSSLTLNCCYYFYY